MSTMIIIGAGLAGLSCGSYAQMNGYQTRIFEQQGRPGGVAMSWRRGQYLVDGGIHFVMGHRPGSATYKIYREVGAIGDIPIADMDSYGRFVDEASGLQVDFTRNLDMLARDLKAIAPEDGRLIEQLISGARDMLGSDMFAALSDPPELLGVAGTLRMLWSMRTSLRYYVGRFSRPMSEVAADARSPLLRQLLLNFFLPEVPGWFAMSLLALVSDRQMGLLDRGCPGFVDPMEERYRSLGGQVQYKARVDKILVDSGTAVGVAVADGSEHRADIIVAAGDAHNAVFQLLGGQYGAAEWEARFREWSLVRPVVMITYGVDASFENQPHLVQLLFKEPLVVGGQSVLGVAVRFFNYGSVFAPPGKTVVQVMLEVGWEYWNNLREKDRDAYRSAKQALASEMLQRLEAHFPGLSASVEMTDVATPPTMWRYTGNYQGAYMGWLPSGKQLMSRIPRTLPGLLNFYMAGQWVSPGGGVPPSIFSGRQLVQVLCHNERRPFVANTSKAGP